MSDCSPKDDPWGRGWNAAQKVHETELNKRISQLQRMEGRAIAAETQALALAEQMLKIDSFYANAIKGHRISQAGCPDRMTKDKNALEIRNLEVRREKHLGADSHFANMARSIVTAAKERNR